MANINNLQQNQDLFWPTKAEAETEKLKSGGEEQGKLKQEDFFALLTQQLSFQDPNNPVENAEMISQMTGFTTADGIAKLGSGFDNLNTVMQSSAALQASNLVGREVLVPKMEGNNTGSGFKGVAMVDGNASNIKVSILNPAGEVVKQIPMGDGNGNMDFSWDGTDAQGNKVATGNYKVKITGMQAGKNTEFGGATFANVDSVSLAGKGSNSAVLNLTGLGSTELKDIIKISENSSS